MFDHEKKTISKSHAILLLIAVSILVTPASADVVANKNASVSHVQANEPQWEIYTIRYGDTVALAAPDAGCNVYSIRVGDTEFLRVPADLRKLRGVSYGTPVLYPTPNRVRGAKFTYQGTTHSFPPNGRGNFIHGLVHSASWQPTSANVTDDYAELTCRLSFEDELDLYKQFPYAHSVRLAIRVSEKRVRWTYSVENKGEQTLPYGFALHPYFNYLGERNETFLQVRAKSLMESKKQLPTGKLLELEDHPLDARTPVSLAGYKADDVFFGLKNDPAAIVDYRDKGHKILLSTSKAFTHCVVYTPDRPFFCVENQTCSTDAHNLSSKGQAKVANLNECGPGETQEGWVEYRFE